ncbi:MAG TPA: ankyrin repeat domain-containing protein, partial [Anaerolineales bacterium]
MMPTPVSAVRQAIKSGDARALETLFQDGVDVECRLEHRWTPMHLAAKHGQLEMASLLLAHGAQINAETNGRQTPLDPTERFQQQAMTKFLS